ncbi:MAG: hypothetical protein IKU81_05355 [Oscillibacter sp.]|nr:hypothetical protein [Oscillibacter sp.]
MFLAKLMRSAEYDTNNHSIGNINLCFAELLMFSNFKDAFTRKLQFTGKKPGVVLKTIRRDWIDGFRYVNDHDGFARFSCDSIMDIVPGSVRLPKKAETLFAGKLFYIVEKMLKKH